MTSMTTIKFELDRDLQSAYQAVAGPDYIPTPTEILVIQCIRLLTVLAQTRAAAAQAYQQAATPAAVMRPPTASQVKVEIGTSDKGANGLTAQQIRDLVAIVRAPGASADETLEQLQREFEALMTGVPHVAPPVVMENPNAAGPALTQPQPTVTAPTVEVPVEPARPGRQ